MRFKALDAFVGWRVLANGLEHAVGEYTANHRGRLGHALGVGGQAVTQTIQLPPRDGEVNCFLDLPAVGETIEARISPDDDLPADNVAWLLRQRAWPRIEVRSALPAELARMVDVYQSHRPASEHSARVCVVFR